jgi:TonB family protein
MTFMQEVVRISDRFMDRHDPDSIDRQGRLGQLVVLIMIFYAIMGIGFVKMQELEKKKPRIIHDVDVSFEFSAPPPEPTFKVGEVPKPISLTEGETANPGSSDAAKAAQADAVTLPTIKADEVAATPNVQAKPVASHHTTEAAPVAVTQVQDIKAAPTQAPKQAPDSAANPSQIAGIANNQQTSGAAQAGGTPDGAAGGTGTGGEGNGGGGTGQGDPGAGTGFGTAGGVIATKIPSTGSRAMGNIAPYRKDLLLKVAQNWHPKKKSVNLIVLVTLSKEGKLLASEIFESSGNKKEDQEALSAIESTEFAPLPEWYHGEQLQIKINLDKEAMQQ